MGSEDFETRLPLGEATSQFLRVLSQNQEECMKIESTLISQSLVESAKALEKKELTNKASGDNSLEESQSFIPSPFGSGRTYSLSSLKSAVDYHAKFLTVAENNMTAVNHPSSIPKGLLDRLNPAQ
jgi:hypothetical protein